jgi:glycosyltransferase involved in cell wall biosynthesis
MKILLINDYETDEGGANLMTLRLRGELRRRGHDARLFASRLRLARGHADYTCFGTLSRVRPLVETCNPSAYLRLRKVLREFRPDVVHVRLFRTQLSPLILPLLRGVPSLLHETIYKSICPLGTKLLPDRSPCRARAGAVCRRGGCLPLRAWLPLMLQTRLWLRWRGAFDLIVTNSEAVARELNAEGIEAAATVWSGVPDGGARPPLADPPTVGFAGRLVALKGADVLLRAFARVADEMPDARLVVVGDGEERENLSRLAHRLGLSRGVEFAGWLAPDDAARRVERAWAIAVPSFSEQFSLTAVEALMRGTAVVASAVGGMPELVREGETGFLVPAGDARALAEKLLLLLRSRETAERMGASARRDALARFRLATCVDEFEKLYETIRGARAARAGASSAIPRESSRGRGRVGADV